MSHSEFSRCSSDTATCSLHQTDGGPTEVVMTSDLVLRLVELETQTERAAQLTEEGRYKSAMASWSRVALLAEAVFGRVDDSVLDASRILASIMTRLGLYDDGLQVLGEIAERLLIAGLRDSFRFKAIELQIKDLQNCRLTMPGARVAAFGGSRG
jgi:hypothetical protein